MLVRLTSSTSGEMIMFAEHARVFFGWIGKECTARGVFLKEQLPEAIARLRHGVQEESVAIQQRLQEKARETREKQRAGHRDDGKAGERKDDAPTEDVTLVQRAQPLIHLMEWTLKEGGFILWEAPGDF
jgi:hypothetical protein